MAGCQNSADSTSSAELLTQIRNSFVAEYAVPKGPMAVGVFGVHSGQLLRRLDLVEPKNSELDGLSEGSGGQLYYAESDIGPQNGEVGVPKSGCSGVLYRLDRTTGHTSVVLRLKNRTLSLPAAGPRPGMYAVRSESCPGNQAQVVVSDTTSSATLTIPTGNTKLSWNAAGTQLLLGVAAPQPIEPDPSAVGSFRLVAVSGSGAARPSARPSIVDPGCVLDQGVFDSYGILESEVCRAIGYTRTRLIQIRGTGHHVLWRRTTKVCPVNMRMDVDASQRTLLLNGARSSDCHNGDIDNTVTIERLGAHGMTTRRLQVGEHFVSGATL